MGLSALPGKLDQDEGQNYQVRISAFLLEEIEKFNRQIGEAVIAICKKPKRLTEGQARELVQKHLEVLSRA
jgi:pyruvate dehydrogenase phosphatase